LKTPAALFLITGIFFAAITGCSKEKENSEPAEPPPTAVVDSATAGSISGTVKLDGAPPTFHPLDMSAEAACVQAHPTPITPPIVVTGEHGALANVVVYIKSGLGRYRYDTPTQPAVLDQKGCMYEPHVLAFMVHQPLIINNNDPTTHNIHPVPRVNHPWNQSQPQGAPPINTSFDHPELAIRVMCNVHPWMRAFFFVFDNPYFAVTTKVGMFDINNIPPGTYTIEAWQEHYGVLDQTVILAPKQAKSISFVFKAAAPH
jgi:hypothetical protein